MFGRIFSVRTWEDYRFYMNGLLDVHACEPIAIHTTIKDMIKLLRFRSNYHHVVNELEFHSAYTWTRTRLCDTTKCSRRR